MVSVIISHVLLNMYDLSHSVSFVCIVDMIPVFVMAVTVASVDGTFHAFQTEMNANLRSQPAFYFFSSHC